MSLKESYQVSLENDTKKRSQEEEYKVISEKFTDWGLLKSWFFYGPEKTMPMPLTANASSLVKEACELIKQEKWLQANFNLERNDVTYNECTIIEKGDLDYSEIKYNDWQSEMTSLIKYKWDDGSIHIGALKRETKTTKPGFFSQNAKAKAETPTFLREINSKRKNLIPYLYGEQQYVILSFMCTAGDGELNRFAMFRDGYIFDINLSFRSSRVAMDNYYIYERSLEYKYNKVPIEKWLIDNIKNINR